MTNINEFLQKAHAVETATLGILHHQIEESNDPVLRERLTEHILETRWQRKLLRACMDTQDARVENGAIAQFNPVIIPQDSDVLSLCKAQIRLYRQLIARAQAEGFDIITEATREIMAQERAMEDWMETYALSTCPIASRVLRNAAAGAEF